MSYANAKRLSLEAHKQAIKEAGRRARKVERGELGLSGKKRTFALSSVARSARAGDARTAKLLPSTNPEVAEHLGWHSDRRILLGREAFGEKSRAAKKAESDLENAAANSGNNKNKKRKEDW